MCGPKSVPFVLSSQSTRFDSKLLLARTKANVDFLLNEQKNGMMLDGWMNEYKINKTFRDMKDIWEYLFDK